MSCRSDVVNAFVEVCGVPADELSDDANLESLEIESLDLIEVAMIMEEKCGAQVNADDFEEVSTFADAVAVFARISGFGSGA
jgi:acyl carrier protein